MQSFLHPSPNNFWRHLVPEKKTVSKLTVHNQKIKNEVDSANCYNQYFSSMFSSDNNSSTPAIDALPNILTIDDFELTEEGTFNLLHKIDPTKVHATDNAPNTFLKRHAKWVSKYLMLIFRSPYLTQLYHYTRFQLKN